jgi:group I intron endonuclease
MKTYIIYKIVHRESGKTYIGATCQGVSHRISGHITKAKRNLNKETIGYAMLTYGRENFDVSELAKASSQQEAFEIEKSFALMFDCVYPKGYNQKLDKLGCSSVVSIPQAVVETIRTAQKKSFFGRKHTEETKAKMRAAALGKKKTEAMKEKLRKLKTGMKWSDEARAKACRTHTGMKWSDRQREGAMKVFATPEYRKNLSKGVKKAKRIKLENSVSH